MDRYTFKYRRIGRLFFKSIKNCYGHTYDQAMDKMEIHSPNGILVLAKWAEYDLKLDRDFIDMQKQKAEEESGQKIAFKR